MSLRDDRRAQSIQIGAVLLFAVLIILLATYQAFVVPNQNREVEGNHVDTVSQQMQELRNAIVSMSSTGGGRSITLTLGVEYPSRAIALNPPSPTGTVRTLGTTDERVDLTVANAVATDGEVDDYWTGTNRTVNSGGIAYRPGYHEYQNPPTIVYENSLLYHQFAGGNLTRAGQRLIDGRRISPVAVNGSMDRSASDSVAVDLQDVSSSSRQVSVTNEPGQNVTLDIATRFNRSQWERELAATGDYDDPNGYVAKVTQSEIPNSEFDVVHLHLERDETYELQMAKVGVGTGVTGTTPKYITAATGQNVESGESFTAEVRDGLNNPVSGVTVQPDGCGLGTKITGEDGQVTFACSQSGTVELQIKDGDENNETVAFGTGASSDDQPPTIDDQETAAEYQQVCLDESFFGGCSRYNYQITQVYSASDAESGLDSISLSVYDETGEVVTELSRTLAGTSEHDGRWTSPLLNVDESVVENYEVHVHAVDTAGNVATCVAGVGDDSCQLDQPGTQSFQATIQDTNSPVNEGETLTTEATVSNTGTETASGHVRLEIDGTEVDSQSVELGPEESTTVALDWENTNTGTHTATVSIGDASDSTSISVGQPMSESVDATAGIAEDSDGSRIWFDLENSGQIDASVTELTLVAVTPDDDDINSEEIYVDRNGNTLTWNGGATTDTISQDSPVSLNPSATIEQGQSGQFVLGDFRDGPGSGNNRIDMDDGQVTISLQFSDGSDREFVLDLDN